MRRSGVQLPFWAPHSTWFAEAVEPDVPGPNAKARRISLDDDTIAILEAQRDRMNHRAATCEVPFNEDSYAFTKTAYGSEPLHPDTITGMFGRAQKRAGLKSIRLHDLRHLHATQLLAAEVPVPTVSGGLGRANSATTLNVYAHFLEASDRDAADVIGKVIVDRPSLKIQLP